MNFIFWDVVPYWKNNKLFFTVCRVWKHCIVTTQRIFVQIFERKITWEKSSYLCKMKPFSLDWSRTVKKWLDQELPSRWIGRGSNGDLSIKWPPRSPDLTPCDFFLWGLNELKNRFFQAFSEVTMEKLHNTMASFRTRLNLVIQNDGCQTEIYKKQKESAFRKNVTFDWKNRVRY